MTVTHGEGGRMSELRTPEEWSRTKGVRILDPDGWRSEGDPAWDEPITETDFDCRAGTSTIGPWNWGAQ